MLGEDDLGGEERLGRHLLALGEERADGGLFGGGDRGEGAPAGEARAHDDVAHGVRIAEIAGGRRAEDALVAAEGLEPGEVDALDAVAIASRVDVELVRLPGVRDGHLQQTAGERHRGRIDRGRQGGEDGDAVAVLVERGFERGAEPPRRLLRVATDEGDVHERAKHSR